MKTTLKSIALLLFIGLLSARTEAQLPVSLKLPQVSPLETRSITIGFTTISFEYSSVGIKGREIWGELVPYNQVWRIGANKNTVFSVSDDVLINGNPLPAGSYGLHAIPGEDKWTLIFSNFSDAWGSYFYDESEDQLRVDVIPEKMNSTYEWMKFSFENYTETSVDMSMKWAGLKVPFQVEVPMEVTFQHISDQFKSLPAFGWQGWYQGANYLMNYEYEMETGLEWANRAVSMEKNPETLTVKARILARMGEKDAAIEAADELTNEFPDEWRAWYGAASTYLDLGNSEKAKDQMTEAIKIAPENWANRLQGMLDEM